MTYPIFPALAVFIGCLLPLQANINAQLAVQLGSPVFAAFVTFIVGSFFLLTMFFLIPNTGLKSPVTEVRWYLFIGGILGGTYILLSIFLMPKIGVTTLMAGAITGQLLLAVVMDHYGFLGNKTVSLDIKRLIGCVLLLVAFLLISKK